MKEGKATLDENGVALLHYGDSEIRFHREDPFPLYPGEKLIGSVK